MAGMDLTVRALREQVAAAIDLVVHVARLQDGVRRVTSVTEVVGMEGDTVTMQDLFVFHVEEGSTNVAASEVVWRRRACVRTSWNTWRNAMCSSIPRGSRLRPGWSRGESTLVGAREARLPDPARRGGHPRPRCCGPGISIRDVDVSEFPTVRLIVSTQEAVDLSDREVEVVENGLAVDVGEVHLLGEGDRVDAVLAIDVSNSMRGRPLNTALPPRTFVNGVPASMPLGVVTFSDEAEVLSSLAEDRASVERAVTSIGDSTSAGTALFDAVATAVAMFDTESNVQHNLILVTDGRNTTGDADLAGAVEAAEAAGMHVFTIGLAGPATDEATLRTLASRTEGPTRRSHLMSSVPSTRGSRVHQPIRGGVPLEGALRDGDTNICAPSRRVGFGGVPGAGRVRASTETRANAQTPGFWAGSVGMGLIALLVPDGRSSRSCIAATGCSAQTRTAAALATDDAARRARLGRGGCDGASGPGTPSSSRFADRLVGGSSAGQRLARRLEHAGWAIGAASS